MKKWENADQDEPQANNASGANAFFGTAPQTKKELKQLSSLNEIYSMEEILAEFIQMRKRHTDSYWMELVIRKTASMIVDLKRRYGKKYGDFPEVFIATVQKAEGEF